MADKTVIAYFMHEVERDAARNMLSGAEVTESYVLGTIDEGRIPDLERQGLIVQVIDDESTEETPASETELTRGSAPSCLKSRPRSPRKSQPLTRRSPRTTWSRSTAR